MLKVLSKGEALPLQNYSFRKTPGIDIVWRGGHVVRPLNGNWFTAPFPTRVISFYCPWRILPFIRWNLPWIRAVGYLGFKAFGVDSPAYENWMPYEHVRVGSVALCPSATFDRD